MKRLSIVCLAFVLAITFGFGNAYATSAKATAQCADFRVVEASTAGASGDGYSTIFTTIVKTPQDKELFIDVSLECGLTTNTKVMSKQLERNLAEADAMVMVRVLVDGNEAAPGEVTFARRKQTLIAEFAGDISNCLSIADTNDDGIPDAVVVDEDCIEPETLQLILDTMTANSFNFMASDLSSDEHKIEVQAKITYSDTPDEWISIEAPATNAYLGKGSVTVETVRMIKGEVVDLTTKQ